MNRRELFQGSAALAVAPDVKLSVRYYDVCSRYPYSMLLQAFHEQIASELKDASIIYADTDGVIMVSP